MRPVEMLLRTDTVERVYETFDSALRSNVDRAVDAVVAARREGRKVVVCIGGTNNVQSGITTLVAELMHHGVVDGVCTTAEVVGCELAGVLEKTRRVDGMREGIKQSLLREGKYFDVALLPPDILEQFQREIDIDISFYRALLGAPGDIVMRAAGGGAYPSGLRTEMLAGEILILAKERRTPFEQMAGYGADPMTMIGAGARLGIPVLVAVSQLVGCGGVGLAIGDSMTVSERAHHISRMMGTAAVVLQSAPCFAENDRDACEVYRGCGKWASWQGKWTWSRANVTTVVIEDGAQTADISYPGDAASHRGDVTLPNPSGIMWPVLADRIATPLGIRMGFMSFGTLPENEAVQEWIVNSVHPADKSAILRAHQRLA